MLSSEPELRLTDSKTAFKLACQKEVVVGAEALETFKGTYDRLLLLEGPEYWKSCQECAVMYCILSRDCSLSNPSNHSTAAG